MVKDTEPGLAGVFRRGWALAVPAATAAAAARVAIGVAALGWPAVPARPWVGASGEDLAPSVLGRALGARDLALGLGTLAALRQPRPAATGPAAPGQAAAAADAVRQTAPAALWFAAAALSDALDTAITVAAWPALPARSRWLVAGSAAGAAIAGAAGAVALLRDQRPKLAP